MEDESVQRIPVMKTTPTLRTAFLLLLLLFVLMGCAPKTTASKHWEQDMGGIPYHDLTSHDKQGR